MVTPHVIPASDAHFRYEGRFDFSDPASPVVIWSGSRISFDFEGAQVALRFAGGVAQNFFNVEVDGASTVISVNRGEATQRIEVPVKTAAVRHQVVVFKRSEATKGHARFLGAEVAAGARVWSPASPPPSLRLEFFGDSITAGACNEDGASDQWDDFRTHNHALSYANLTAAAFHADHRAIAVSGIGIVHGYVDVQAGQVWNKIYPRADAPVADLSAWQPHVAFVNFGENDASFSVNQHLPFPAGYTAGYVALVRSIRAAYPQAHLVLLRGGMFCGAKSPVLQAAWQAAVQELEARDAAISHYVFAQWSDLHPRVSEHRAMAGELTNWLKQQPWMAPFR